MYIAGISTEVNDKDNISDYKICAVVMKKETGIPEIIQVIERYFNSCPIIKQREEKKKLILYLTEQYQGIKILIEYEK